MDPITWSCRPWRYFSTSLLPSSALEPSWPGAWPIGSAQEPGPLTPRPSDLFQSPLGPFLSAGTPWEAPRSCPCFFSLSTSSRAPSPLRSSSGFPASLSSPLPGFPDRPLCPRLRAGAGRTVSTERGPTAGNGLANVYANRKCHMLQQGSIPEGSMEEVTFKLGLGLRKYSKLEHGHAGRG